MHFNSLRITIQHDAVRVDATLLAKGLGVDAGLAPALLRSGEITSLCERGIDDDEGRYRLIFFHGGKRFRMVIGNDGRVIRHSTIDFGDRPLLAPLRRPER